MILIKIESVMVAWGYKNFDGSVKENVIRDITFGWLKKDGAVDSATVAGDVRYRTDSAFRADTPVVITYHTFKKK